MILCDYGCGREGKYFFKTVGKFCCEEHWTRCPARRPIGNKNPMYGKTHNQSAKDKIGNIHKEKSLSEKTIAKIRKTFKEKFNNNLPGSFKKGHIPWIKGKKRPEIVGENNPAKLPRVREILRQRMLGDLNPSKKPSVKQKISKKAKKRFQDKIWLKKFQEACNLKPNHLEEEFKQLLNIIAPNKFKYTGDFKFWIDGKNPDFTWKDGRKVIELFGDYWHSPEKTGVPVYIHEQNKISHYEKNNFKCIVIWEHELQNINLVKNKVMEFINLSN